MNLIEINLLPPEMRPKKKFVMPEISFLPILIWAVSSLFIIQVILLSLVRYERQQLNKLNTRWQGLTSSNAKLSELKAELKVVTERVATIEELFKRRFIWARKLNQLSDVLSKGIWLDDIHLEIKTQAAPQGVKGAKPKKFYLLLLQGTAVSREEEETAVIGRFMKDLKAHMEFFADFSDIELGSIQSDKIGGRDVMHFTITCYFKEGAIQ